MKVINPSIAERQQIFVSIDRHLEKKGPPIFVKYLQLGSQVVRLINYSQDFTYHINLQLGYILRDDAPSYDCTFILWHEHNITNFTLSMITTLDIVPTMNSDLYRKLRYHKATNKEIQNVTFFDETIFYNKPFISSSKSQGTFFAYNPHTKTYYNSVSDLSPEEYIKKGHMLVATLNHILRTPISNLAHGAIVGLDNTGILLCGVGNRGKSTLSVRALLDGFDYVSDDFLVLEKKAEQLLSWPIYSIIALSPQMYQNMMGHFNAVFVSNNARRDKYIFNIANYHGQFRSGYPVKLGMYLRFTKGTEPSIEPGDKDIAIRELIMSTVCQMGEADNVQNIAKTYSFVEHLPFYRFNLVQNIDNNVQYLRKFLGHFIKEHA